MLYESGEIGKREERKKERKNPVNRFQNQQGRSDSSIDSLRVEEMKPTASKQAMDGMRKISLFVWLEL